MNQIHPEKTSPSRRIKRVNLFITLCIAFGLVLAACNGTSSTTPTSAFQGFNPTADLATPSQPPASQTVAPTQPAPATAAPTSLPLTSTTLASVAPAPATQLPPATALPTNSGAPGESIHFAVIGDFGQSGAPEQQVADLVKSWKPDFIVTTGDNNYPSGSGATLDENVGRYYHDYIYPYRGKFGAGADQNRFFPVLGNHDWIPGNVQAYTQYFSGLPGNKRYYDFVEGPVHFFAIDSDPSEPDKVGKSSAQAAWLKQGLAAAKEPWKVVVFHTPPYSSGPHGGTDWMLWPFKEWGTSLVLCGHDHDYERLAVDGLPYFVNGLGGGAIYQFKQILPQSQAHFTGDWGAMRVEASPKSMSLEFITREGQVIDKATLSAQK